MNAPDLALKSPPHSVEAEQSLIGGLLLDNNAWDRIVDLVSESDFYRDDHRRIFRHIGKLVMTGRAADVVTVFESIEQSNEVDQTGGLAYLAEVANATPSAANVHHYAKIVRERAVRRALIVAIGQADAALWNAGSVEPANTIAVLESECARLLDDPTSEPVGADVAIADLARAIDAGRPPGLRTGFRDLDRLTGGMYPGQMIVAAARPSVGKTAFALNIAQRVAGSGGRVLFFSLEMTRTELAERLLAMRAQVTTAALRSQPTDAEWSRIAAALPDPAANRIVIDDRAAVTTAYVRARARRLHRKSPLALIVIDYLQLMSPSTEARASRSEQVGSLSRGLKALAKEIGVPIIALAQLNRGVESRADRRPMLSDLRDSGEVEQDADSVLFLYRSTEGHANAGPVIGGSLAKNRSGRTGEFFLDSTPRFFTFADRDGPPPAPEPQRGQGFQ